MSHRSNGAGVAIALIHVGVAGICIYGAYRLALIAKQAYADELAAQAAKKEEKTD